MNRIALLYGGMSTEHEVSCISAQQVFTKLISCGYEAIPVGITRTGGWFIQDHVETDSGSLSIICDESARITLDPEHGLLRSGKPVAIDCILPITHGTYGEDGCLQGLLEMLPIPFTGSNHYAAAAAMKKSLGKLTARHLGIPLLDYRVFSSADSRDHILNEVETSIGYPCIVKPECGGSSVGVSKAETREELKIALHTALRYDSSIICEQFGTFEEVECTVIGSDDHILTTRTGSIQSHGTIYGYDLKYRKDQTIFTLPSEFENARTEERIREYAALMHKALGCAGFTRIDFFYEPKQQNTYFNEVNTIPGLTPASLCMRLGGISCVSWMKFFSLIFEDAEYQYAKRRNLDIGGQV
jgi:D-alanine-D-alanine ligase